MKKLQKQSSKKLVQAVDILDCEGLTPGLALEALEEKWGFIWSSTKHLAKDKNRGDSNSQLIYLGLAPHCILSFSKNCVTILRESTEAEDSRHEVSSGEILEEEVSLQTELDPLVFASEHLRAVSIEKDPKFESIYQTRRHFIGGYLGFISYDCVRHFEKISRLNVANEIPDLLALEVYNFLIFDNKTNKLIISCCDETLPKANNKVLSLSKKVKAIIRDSTFGGTKHSQNNSQIDYQLALTKETFSANVRKALDYIDSGDIFQIVLSNSLKITESYNPYRAFDSLIKDHPAPYHFLLKFKDSIIFGASPEVMLCSTTLQNQTVISTRLVAGTYPHDRATDPKMLRADEKELAEHIMLVDHARNDIGRVAKTASVVVDELLSVESYPTVYHLVSQVSGTLRDNENIWSALRSFHPIATLTGTPKIRAMEIICELENSPRGLFGGTLFQVNHEGDFDSSVIIRTAYATKQATIIQVGAGIVADSKPEREFDECLWKAHALLDVIAKNRI